MWTASRVGQNLDVMWSQLLNYCPCLAGTGTGTVVVNEGILLGTIVGRLYLCVFSVLKGIRTITLRPIKSVISTSEYWISDKC